MDFETFADEGWFSTDTLAPALTFNACELQAHTIDSTRARSDTPHPSGRANNMCDDRSSQTTDTSDCSFVISGSSPSDGDHSSLGSRSPGSTDMDDDDEYDDCEQGQGGSGVRSSQLIIDDDDDDWEQGDRHSRLSPRLNDEGSGRVGADPGAIEAELSELQDVVEMQSENVMQALSAHSNDLRAALQDHTDNVLGSIEEEVGDLRGSLEMQTEDLEAYLEGALAGQAEGFNEDLLEAFNGQAEALEGNLRAALAEQTAELRDAQDRHAKAFHEALETYADEFRGMLSDGQQGAGASGGNAETEDVDVVLNRSDKAPEDICERLAQDFQAFLASRRRNHNTAPGERQAPSPSAKRSNTSTGAQARPSKRQKSNRATELDPRTDDAQEGSKSSVPGQQQAGACMSTPARKNDLGCNSDPGTVGERVNKQRLVVNLIYHYREMISTESFDEEFDGDDSSPGPYPGSEQGLVLKWPRDLTAQELVKCQEITKDVRGNERFFLTVILKQGNPKAHLQAFLAKVCAKSRTVRDVLARLIFALELPMVDG